MFGNALCLLPLQLSPPHVARAEKAHRVAFGFFGGHIINFPRSCGGGRVAPCEDRDPSAFAPRPRIPLLPLGPACVKDTLSDASRNKKGSDSQVRCPLSYRQILLTECLFWPSYHSSLTYSRIFLPQSHRGHRDNDLQRIACWQETYTLLRTIRT